MEFDSLEFTALNGEDALLAWADGRQGDFPLFLRAAANELGLNQVGLNGSHSFHMVLINYAPRIWPAPGIWQRAMYRNGQDYAWDSQLS